MGCKSTLLSRYIFHLLAKTLYALRNNSQLINSRTADATGSCTPIFNFHMHMFKRLVNKIYCNSCADMKLGSFMSEKTQRSLSLDKWDWSDPPLSASYKNLVLQTSHSELDLTNQSNIESFFTTEKPLHVILAAAKVGGIHAKNKYPADFISVNLQIRSNIIQSAYTHGVKKLLFFGSSCIYPKFAPQPIPESALLTGLLEPTNEWYVIAKIARIMRLCFLSIFL